MEVFCMVGLVNVVFFKTQTESTLAMLHHPRVLNAGVENEALRLFLLKG